LKIPFIGGAYEGKSSNLNAQTCVNLYPVYDNEEGKNVRALYGTPGMKQFCDPSNASPVRNMLKMGDYLYAVVGTSLYRVDSSGNATAMTGSLTTSSGPVWLSNNGTELMIVDPGVEGYILSGTTLSAISDTDFPTPSSVTFQDGYFIITQDDTDTIWISGLNDGTSWDALDYAAAEDKPDDATVVISDHEQIWVIGEDSTEVYYNSGNADFPFERISGGILECGIYAPNSIAQLDNTLFWLDNFGCVIRIDGFHRSIISTRQIEYQIAQYSTIDDAIGFAYVQEGHSFYVLTFPSVSATWVYDASTGLWHQRSSYPHVSDGSWNRHRANCYEYFAGKHLIGDCENGKIYEWDMDTFSDDGNEIRRERASQSLHGDRRYVFIDKFEVEFEAGTGTAVDDSTIGEGADPQAALSWSDDGGHTWSNEHWTDIGVIGSYGTRAVWRRLGRSRNRVFRVLVSDPVKVVMIAAYAKLRQGVS